MNFLKKSAFTLTELLIVVLIIGLMSTLAAETYVTTYEKSKGFNAVAMLRMIRAAERIYYMDWNTYTELTLTCGPATTGLVAGGYIQCPNTGSASDRAFNYTVTAPAANNFTATATRTGGRFTTQTIVLNDVSGVPTWSGSWRSDWRP